MKYISFKWQFIRMFNRLPKAICMLSTCSVVGFKSKLDSYLRKLWIFPAGLDGGDCGALILEHVSEIMADTCNVSISQKKRSCRILKNMN